MRRLIMILALCGLLTPSLASAQTAPVVMGYRTATGAAQAVAALTPLPVTAAALSTLTTMLAAPAAAIPPLAALVGMSDGTFIRPFRARDLDTGAGTDYWQGVGLMLAGAGGGTPASAGEGNVDAGTIRTVPGSISSSTPLALVAVDASEVEVLPALAGRRGWGIQVYNDQDGPICCSLGATTSACANAGFMLDPSPAASRAGGSKGDAGYSGAVTCRAMGAYTVSVARFQY
jgi:hypothetical protein